MQQRQCKRCGGAYPLVFFRISQRDYALRAKRKNTICIGCEQTERDEKKRYNRPRKKARDAYRRHAKKFVERDIIKSQDELAQYYGWDIDQMTHDIEHASTNGCPYCHQPFSDMAYGLSDLTLDIVDPEKPPYYTTNVRWVCATCNMEKQRTPPSQWGAKLVSWQRWREIRQKNDIWHGTLFEGTTLLVGE